jgi:SNF2 family DNA or RNA helicase
MGLHERHDVLTTFEKEDGGKKKGPMTVLLVSLTAGSSGLNLTCASQCIFLEPSYNPFLEIQGMGRVHRIGQRRDVTVHKIVIPGTVEDRICELQEKVQRLTMKLAEVRKFLRREKH